MANWIEVKGYREKRANLISNAGAILRRSVDEKREMTPEETAEFEKLHAAADALLAQIDACEKQVAGEASVDGEGDDEEQVSERFARPHIETRSAGPKSEREELRLKAFNKKLRGFDLTEAEKRSLTLGGTGTGGDHVPTGFYDGFVEKLVAFGGVRKMGPEVIPASNGQPIPIPVFDDTSNEGEIITEATDTADADATPSKVTLSTHIFSSKRFGLGKAYIQDVAYNAEAAVQSMAVKRIGRKSNKAFTTGTGTGEPLGCVTGASVGKAAAAAAAVTYNEILDLIHSLDDDYRDGAKLMLNDSTLLAVRKLVDADGNPIWHHGVNAAAAGMPPTIAGVEYVKNSAMPNLGASAKPILYGNMAEGYVIVDVTGAELLVDPYSLSPSYQIAYTMFSRHGGTVKNASALKVLQCAAS